MKLFLIATRSAPALRGAAVIAVMAAALSASPGGAPSQSASQPCDDTPPAGFRAVSNLSAPWSAWALSASTPRAVALPMLDHSLGKDTRSTTLRLDDGTRGTLHVEARDCGPKDDCAPYDCGCTGPMESYWIEIRRSNGAVLAHKHLWAAYGRFQIVPVDLLGGPGDELLIARVPAHASPPIGWDLQIWEVGNRIVDIGGMSHLTTSFASLPFSCARWLATLTVDPRGAKPKPIAVAVDFAFNGCCRVGEEARRLSDLKRPHALRFDSASRQYVLTGPAPGAFSRD